MNEHFAIANLGACQIDSPLNISGFVSDDDRILFNTRLSNYAQNRIPKAGFYRWSRRARGKEYF